MKIASRVTVCAPLVWAIFAVEFALRSQHETFPDFGIQLRNDFND